MDLKLSNNRLNYLLPELAFLKIQSLDLSHNNFNCFPQILNNLTFLTSLDLSNNPLKFIPPEITNLQLLTNLSLNCTDIYFLPKEIGKLKNLSILSVKSNKISCLPDEICYIENLRWLSVAKNNLCSLPKEIFLLQNLNHLNLSRNRFTEIPKGVQQLMNLKYFDLSYNAIFSVSEEHLIEMNQITVLNLIGNDPRLSSTINTHVHTFILLEEEKKYSKLTEDCVSIGSELDKSDHSFDGSSDELFENDYNSHFPLIAK